MQPNPLLQIERGSAIMLRSLLLIFVTFCIKKPFISSDSGYYSFDFGLIEDVPVMYVYE